MNEENSIEQRVRLRLSISPSLNQMLEETAEALGIHPTTVATFAFSIGLRALRPMVLPAQIPGMKDFMDRAASSQVNSAVSDAGGVLIK